MIAPGEAVKPAWDILCKVVDNLGDIGVCWRLARMLCAGHGIKVRLWVDDLRAHQRICPPVMLCDRQWVEGVEVRHWRADSVPDRPPAVVIDAFGCGVPDAWLAVMTDPAAVWVNLEYLSAEAWVADCHGLAGSVPGAQVKRRFFFPGFEAATGGLMREGDLIARREAFRADPQGVSRVLRALGAEKASGLRVFLFCYPNPALGILLDAMARGPCHTDLFIPEGPVAQAAARHLGAAGGGAAVSLHIIPWVPQNDFDELLWSMDVNFVRGEDSFVRAQWAGSPFVWHIYPQEAGTHLKKLDAFLGRFDAGGEAASLTTFTRAWNRGTLQVGDWQALLASLPAISERTRRWADFMCTLPELTDALVQFCAKPV